MIKIPVMHGSIDRRILVNFTADPMEIQQLLPPVFRPKLQRGLAVAGICLIRLKHLKPKGFPDFMGLNSENGAHRIAVEWEENGETKSGVYIPRRDTSSRLNAWLGGRFFPGRHYHADFDVRETADSYHVAFDSTHHTQISITARAIAQFPQDSVFDHLDQASAFFESGATGYSPNGSHELDGIQLHVYDWNVTPLEVTQVKASFFEQNGISVRFDNALLMTRAEHEWRSVRSMHIDRGHLT